MTFSYSIKAFAKFQHEFGSYEGLGRLAISNSPTYQTKHKTLKQCELYLLRTLKSEKFRKEIYKQGKGQFCYLEIVIRTEEENDEENVKVIRIRSNLIYDPTQSPDFGKEDLKGNTLDEEDDDQSDNSFNFDDGGAFNQMHEFIGY